MLGKAVRRAFRLRIEPTEITPNEARALTSATPAITEPHLQAFLAWRRSVLFLVAVLLVPLTVLRFLDVRDMPDQLRFIVVIPALAEAFLCAVCWYQLKHWMSWRRQRRALVRAWIVFMAAPFLVFLVPVDSVLGDQLADQPGAAATVKAAIAVVALLTLAPKAVSLLAGTVRAGIVTKMLFPGTAGPGWIVVLATPLYALFVFTLLIVPFQLTGSGWYFGAMAALAIAQIGLGRLGYALARPMTHQDAVDRVAKARTFYLIAMLGFGACMLAALGSIVDEIGVGTILTTILGFESNVLMLTLIGSDLMITNLERARGLTSGTAQHVEDSNKQLTAFVGEGDATASR